MKKKLISIFAAAVIACSAASPDIQQALGSSYSTAYAATVSKPSASLKSGTYSASSSIKVKLTAQSGASIYYSTGGTYKKYTKPISITKNTTLKFYAIKNGTKSAGVTRSYKLYANVKASPSKGEYSTGKTVKLSTTASGVKLYYTTDGSKPTTKSKLYKATGIKITDDTKLRVLAKKSGWSSKYYTFEYKIASEQTGAAGMIDDYTEKYAYNTLNSVQKYVYTELFKTAEKHGGSIDLSEIKVTTADVEKAYWAFDYENPQFFWLANGYNYYTLGNRVVELEPTYSRTESEARKILPKFEKAADKIISEAAKQPDLFERVKYLHDSVADMTKYTYSGPQNISEADGVLVSGKALCEGYSKAFMYLCQKSGIECICVSGDNGGPHMWNMLKLDGEWYHMDVTFDDPIMSDNSDAIFYDAFCINDSQLRENGYKIENPFLVPKSTANAYNYYNYLGIKKYSDVSSAFNALVAAAVENYNNGIMETEIRAEPKIMNALSTKVNSNICSELTAKGVSFAAYSYVYSGGLFRLTLS